MRHILFSSLCLSFSLALPVTSLADPALDDVISAYDAFQLESSPDAMARSEGGVASTWPDVSLARSARTTQILQTLSNQLGEIDTDALDEDEAINHAILSTIIDDQIMLAGFDENRLPFTGDWGYLADIVFSVSRARLRTAEDVENTIARIEAIPAYLDVHKTNIRRGLNTGWVSYADPFNTVIQQLREQVEKSPEESELYEPFKNLPVRLSEHEKAGYEAEALAAVETAIAGLTDTLAFLETEYAPRTRVDAGVVNLPRGKDYYRVVLAQHTTRADLTPEEVHEIGLSEVARIRAEMDAIIEELEFEGSFADFIQFLRTDPQFYANTPEELMMRAARIAKDIDYRMPEFFGTLPRLSYGVEPVPASIAPGYTTGRYSGGDPETGRAGAYWVNTYALDQRPLYQLPALTAHEAVPGHHHQIALSQELEDVPEFRRNYYATAFGEGWGLYSEHLVAEMDIYDTPYERFGKLSYEMWRACRLVADTGLHWYGWTREEAETCFEENTALAAINIQTEVTRYIGWPGQATAYKMGELTIRALRAEAEEALGEDFDIRVFHDVVLEKGALPLGLLETRVRAWIAEELAAAEE